MILLILSSFSFSIGFDPVITHLNYTATSTAVYISWLPPTQSSSCYNLSHYNVQCYNQSSVGGVRGRALLHSINTTMMRPKVTVSGLVPDSKFYCNISVLVTDTNGAVYSLATPTNFSGNTLPSKPPQPATPTYMTPPTSDVKPLTVTIDLVGFKSSLNGGRLGDIRIAVLRLGSSPTLPHGSPDLRYTSHDAFTTYDVVHSNQGGGPDSKPYYAGEFRSDIHSIPDTFIIGDNNTRGHVTKRAVAIGNGPLLEDNYYTFFVRVFAYSQFGSQEVVYNSTSFSSPVKPIPRTGPTSESPSANAGGSGAGIAVGLVLLILFLLAVVIAVAVVALLLWR